MAEAEVEVGVGVGERAGAVREQRDQDADDHEAGEDVPGAREPGRWGDLDDLGGAHRCRHDCSLGLTLGLRAGHEVDQLLDPAEQGRLAVGVRPDAGRGSAARRGRRRPGRGAASRAPRRSRASTPRRAGSRARRRARAAPASRRPRRRRTGGRPRGRAGRRGSGVRRRRCGVSLEPGTRWSTRTPTRRPGPGPKSRRWPARSSTPPRCSTTTPSSRRSSPHTFSTSSASCRPSTKIRLCAGHAGTGVGDGDRSRRRTTRASPAPTARTGAARTTGRPSSRKPGPSGKVRRRPRRSSSVSDVEIAVDRDDLTAPVGRDLLDDERRASPRPGWRGLVPEHASRTPARRRSSGQGSPRHARCGTNAARSRRAGSGGRGVVESADGSSEDAVDDDEPDVSSTPVAASSESVPSLCARPPAGAGRRARRRPPAGRAGCRRSAGDRRGAGRRGPSAGRPRRTTRRRSRSVPGSRVVSTRWPAEASHPQGWKGLLRPAAARVRRAAARRTRGRTALTRPSRGNGHSPSASARSAGTPDAARSRIVWATMAIASRCSSTKSWSTSAPCPGTTTVSGPQQAEHDVERAAARPADSSRPRRPAAPLSSIRSPASSTSTSSTRTTASPSEWPRPGCASSTCRSPRSRTRTEEKVWSATTISVVEDLVAVRVVGRTRRTAP